MSGYVLDASVAVTALTEPSSPGADLLSEVDADFQVPSIFDADMPRALVRGGKVRQCRAGGGRSDGDRRTPPSTGHGQAAG
jgi:hypothetical protein